MGGIRVGVRVSREGLGRLSKTSVLSFKHLSYSAQPLKIYSILHIYVFYTSLLMLCLHKAYPIYIYSSFTRLTLHLSYSIHSLLLLLHSLSTYSIYSHLILLLLLSTYLTRLNFPLSYKLCVYTTI